MPRPKLNKKQVIFRLSPEIVAKINVYSQKTLRNKSQFVEASILLMCKKIDNNESLF